MGGSAMRLETSQIVLNRRRNRRSIARPEFPLLCSKGRTRSKKPPEQSCGTGGGSWSGTTFAGRSFREPSTAPCPVARVEDSQWRHLEQGFEYHFAIPLLL